MAVSQDHLDIMVGIPMTEENRPLIGPIGIDGTYVVGALSDFGAMTACTAVELCAAGVNDDKLPDYVRELSLQRYQDAELMNELTALNNRGIL